jgi:hypothetical protein
MNSYISSFRAVFTALAIVGLIEVGHASVDSSSPVQRSNYLNWNYNSVELYHKAFINEKLSTALRNRPDVIQVGDSSGFHGIVPSIVDQYLGGLRYENISCCANTGFDGYYSIVEFMLRHVPTIKAVVLYMSLNNTPHDPSGLETALVGGADRLRSAFGPLSTLTTPGTLSLRHEILREVYNVNGTFNQEGLIPAEELWPELIESIRTTRGWRPEGDVHRFPEKQEQKWREFCGPDGARHVDGHLPKDYMRDIFGVRHTYTEIEMRRLAALAARHNAKLVLLVQPYPCAEIKGSYVSSLRADIESVGADFPNLIVPEPQLFEAWPSQLFSSPDHVKTGQEDAASRRAGRLIARALGVAYREPERPALSPSLTPVFTTRDFDPLSLTARGLTRTPLSTGEGVIAVETAETGPHLLETKLPSLPANTYVASVTFKTDALRQVFVQFLPLLWPGDAGHFHCSASAGEVNRTMSVLDSAIERLPDGKVRCSATFRLSKPGTVLIIGLSPNNGVGPYPGDGASGVSFYKFELSSVAQ